MKIVLVDDERVILEGMSSILSQGGDVVIAGTAINGIDGMSLIRREKPELVITDIRMPGMSGLDMIENCIKECHDTLFVIISGYSDFKYAQRAIGLGVIDYLEKPVTAEHVMKIVERAGRIIDLRANRDAYSTDKSTIMNIVERYVKGDIKTEDDFMLRLAKVGEVLDSVSKIVVAVAERKDAGEVYGGIREALSVPIIEGADTNIISFTLEGRLVLCYFCYDKRNIAKLTSVLKSRKEVLHSKNIIFCLGVSRVFDGIRFLREAYAEAVLAIRYAMFVGEERTIFIDEIENENKIPINFAQNCESVVLNIRTGKYEKALKLIEEYLINLKKLTLTPEYYCHACLKVIYTVLAVAEESGMTYTGKKEFMPHIEIKRYKHINDMSEYVMQTSGEIMQWIKQERNSNSTIGKIKEYIQQRYNENVSLDAIAEQFHMTPAYLSIQFKKKVGLTYSKYLTDIRMENAMLLLRAGVKAKDVCTKVGYYDYKHFSIIFKKHTGVSPDQYKKNK